VNELSAAPETSLARLGKPSGRLNRRTGRIRILHVLRAMNRGGIETWLMHTLRHIDRERFEIDFLVGTREPADYDEEIRDFGCRIIPIARPNPRRPRQAGNEFLQVLRTRGPYDVVHAHEQEMSGYYLRYAAKAAVAPALRIAHSHNDATRFPGYRATLGNRLRASIMRRWIRQYATHGLACSRLAAEVLFGSGWDQDARWQVFPYGFDLEPFAEPVDRDRVRAEFGIKPHDFVIGHVGRLDAQKNHAFLIEIVRELKSGGCPVKLLMLGNGPIRAAIEERVRSAGLANEAIFAGVRADVPRVMLGAMDVFVFPSHYEGLGLVLLEAQAAGLPCVVSDRIPPEAKIEEALFHTLPLSRTAAEWADVILSLPSVELNRDRTIGALGKKGFDIRQNVRRLEDLYADARKQRD
jgi:glycosyltransferase involved in cell wall biosynthesis